MATLEIDDNPIKTAGEKEVTATTIPPLRDSVRAAVEKYFEQLDGQPTVDLYAMVIAEIEEPLLIAVMRHTSGNQSKAAALLGLSRGTLRKKLEQYQLLD